jgi:nucleotidyltransferase substrate binding protein (TIGR01987 family)
MNTNFWKEDLKQSVKNLRDVADTGLRNDIEQDAFIKRFELSYELAWKWLQSRLNEEGVIAKSPRQVFKEAVKLGYITDEITWLEMIETRNTLVHIYNAMKARLLAAKIQSDYLPILDELV